MATPISRDAYFDTGLEVLSDLGYGGLKLAEVCRRLGVTSGSFYHYFKNWPCYTTDLITHWRHVRTVNLIEMIGAETDPRRRLDRIIDIGLNLPHGAEAAIRTWSSTDSRVRAVQVDVDKQRFDIVKQSVFAILEDERRSEFFANWALYLLIGYEQSALPPDREALRWLINQMLKHIDTSYRTSEFLL